MNEIYESADTVLTTKQQNTETLAEDKDENCQQKKSRFKKLSSEDVNEIAEKIVKPKTRKQTIWGVNVFRGTFFSIKNIYFALKVLKNSITK